jgi:aryl-alcohol dehydrogenase-like predicted oxidoreductase
MEKKKFGNTTVEVTRLGIGLSELGYDLSLDEEAQAADILNTALDRGINFLDTAACYGVSEELIGRTISHRRDDFILSTKAGHTAGKVSGSAWTGETVSKSIDQSLERMRTDHVDIVHLHSCSVEILERGDVIQVLQDAKQAGKTRYIGYSGDNESAHWAVDSGQFDSLQTSYNLVDQGARYGLFSKARGQGLGIICKRPIANAAWGAKSSPSSYAREYFRRYQIMIEEGPLPTPDNPIRLALGFVLAEDAIDTAIVGTSNLQHLQDNIDIVENGPPVDPMYLRELLERYDQVGTEWNQQG